MQPIRSPLATNTDKNFIKMPCSCRLSSAGSDISGNRRTELQNPALDRFIADNDPSFRQYFLDVPKKSVESKNGVLSEKIDGSN